MRRHMHFFISASAALPGAYPSGGGCLYEGRAGKGGKEGAAGHGCKSIIPVRYSYPRLGMFSRSTLLMRVCQPFPCCL